MKNFTGCERRELPSQYGRPKKSNKIFNIGRRTILYKTFADSVRLSLYAANNIFNLLIRKNTQ